MAEEDTKDYWSSFINEIPQSKQKNSQPDYSVLSFIDTLTVASPKKPEEPEKIHPFLQIANHKKTKIGLEVQELISQRHRCKNYSEIHQEEQRKQALKLREKMLKKPSRKNSRGPSRPSMNGTNLPKSRKAPRDKIESDSDQEGSLQQKKEQKTGPPYMPNVISMNELYKKVPKDNDKGKKKEKDIRSRSRSKRYRKQQERKKHDEDLGISPEKSEEVEKKPVQSHSQPQEQGSKKITSPLDRLQKTFEDKSQSNYLFDSRSMKPSSLQDEPKHVPTLPIQAQVSQNNEQIKPESSKTHEPKESPGGDNKTNFFKPQEPKLEGDLVQGYASNKSEDYQKIERLKQEQKFRAEAERMKRNLQDLCKEVAMKKQQLEQNQRKIKQASQKVMSSKYKTSTHQSKKKSHHHHKNRSRSRSPKPQEWQKQLRKVTRYNPHDEKYRTRDRWSIQESGFTQMNIEQAHSRKMGRREQQEEEQRYFQKTSRKRHH